MEAILGVLKGNGDQQEDDQTLPEQVPAEDRAEEA
jgi:hypothetical protein